MTAALVQALRLLRAHKLRAGLTLFGLVWGTASVIFLVAWGRGNERMLHDGFMKAGKNMGEVWAGRIGEDFTPAVDRRYLWFEYDQVEVLRRRARIPDLIGAEAWEFLPLVQGPRSHTVDMRGADPQAMAIRDLPMAAGRSITQSDLDHRRRVLILGDGLRKKLLGPEGRVGSMVRVDGKPFRVIGLLDRVGTQLSRDRNEIDELAFMPITTKQAYWPKEWSDRFVLEKVIFRVADPLRIDDAKDEVRVILSEQLGVKPTDDEAIHIWSSLDMLSRLPIAGTNALLFVLAAATLGIGGVGVLAMMLDSVHERRQEIGIRMAVGARRRDVLLQFFAETLVICLVGGFVGAALGIASCLGLARLEVPDLIPVPILDAQVVALAFGVLVFVGVTAGVVPAWRAARVDPAVTLRME